MNGNGSAGAAVDPSVYSSITEGSIFSPTDQAGALDFGSLFTQQRLTTGTPDLIDWAQQQAAAISGGAVAASTRVGQTPPSGGGIIGGAISTISGALKNIALRGTVFVVAIIVGIIAVIFLLLPTAERAAGVAGEIRTAPARLAKKATGAKEK